MLNVDTKKRFDFFLPPQMQHFHCVLAWWLFLLQQGRIRRQRSIEFDKVVRSTHSVMTMLGCGDCNLMVSPSMWQLPMLVVEAYIALHRATLIYMIVLVTLMLKADRDLRHEQHSEMAQEVKQMCCWALIGISVLILATVLKIILASTFMKGFGIVVSMQYFFLPLLSKAERWHH